MLGSVQAQTPYYYLDRSFSAVQFDLQGIPTEYQLNEEADKLTDIVQGEIQLDTNETYAIEKQAAIPICYGSAEAAWNAAIIYNGTPSNYPGKTFDNVGWVRGTKSVNGDWGAYLWVIQNRIAFQSSTSAWWSTTNGVPVAITNVMVGSLGDYGPVSNVVDIGPNIPTNYLGPNQKDWGTYQVDITNVYYELVIPDIWITPRETVRCVEGTNIQYTVVGTNIPNGVNWSLIPDLSGSDGAEIQSNGAWQAEVMPGNVATNYKVRATSVDNTNFYDQVDLAVRKVDIVETNIYLSVSNTATLHITTDSSANTEWEIIPELQGGAYIEGSDSGTSVVINSGSIPTNYTVKAYAEDLTNCYDTCTVTVLNVEFKEFAPCSGFDGTISPPWIMVPEGSNNLAKAETLPGSAASQIGFESADTNIALVSPAQASTSPQTITLSGFTNDSTEIRAKLAQSSNVCATLGVDVKKRIDKTVAIHAITEENDDVQVIPATNGQPNQVCITAGTNGVLDSTAGGDDVTNANTIITGPNGVCESEAGEDDVPVIDIDQGQPNAICVTKGANNFRDTNPAGYDAVNGDSIDTGDDGICDTPANNQNLVPANVPSASELEDYLNNTTWGKQANVYFTVYRSDTNVNYDLDRSEQLADPVLGSATTNEINEITDKAKDTTKDYNLYYVKEVECPTAFSWVSHAESWVGDEHLGTAKYVSAHETGHLLGDNVGTNAIIGIDLMGEQDSAQSPYRIRKVDWDYVNDE